MYHGLGACPEKIFSHSLSFSEAVLETLSNSQNSVCH